MFFILGLICIILGFVTGIAEEKILLGTLEWFIAAIAFNTLGEFAMPAFTRKG